MAGILYRQTHRLLTFLRNGQDSSNPRTVPEDILRLRPAFGYVVAPCDSTDQAELGVRSLLDAGFAHDELVLVSNRVHTLRPYPDQDALEVPDSTRLARQGGWTSGIVTGACFGALLGLLFSVLTNEGQLAYALGVLVGGLVGAAFGAFVGRWGAGLMRRRPDSMYDHELRDDQILIGVAVDGDDAQRDSDSAHQLLSRAGLQPRMIAGEHRGDEAKERLAARSDLQAR
jgi:hypothetical protein